MVEINVALIRECRGAQLAVLLLLRISPRPVTRAWLERSSGYTKFAVNQACAYLQEKGLVENSQDGWFLVVEVGLPGRGVDNLPPISIIDPDLKDMDVNNNKKTPSGRKSTPPQPNVPRKSPPNPLEQDEGPGTQEMWELLKGAGVFKNARTREMLRMEHVTPEYVRVKIEEHRERGLGKPEWTGLLIRAIEEHEPLPPLAENGHRRNCMCVTCKVERAFSRT